MKVYESCSSDRCAVNLLFISIMIIFMECIRITSNSATDNKIIRPNLEFTHTSN